MTRLVESSRKAGVVLLSRIASLILEILTAGVTQLVESQPSKLLVAGSSPVSRSRKGVFASENFSGALPVCQFRFAEPRFHGRAKFCC